MVLDGNYFSHVVGIKVGAATGLSGGCRGYRGCVPSRAGRGRFLGALGAGIRGDCSSGSNPLALRGFICPYRNECDAAVFRPTLWLESPARTLRSCDHFHNGRRVALAAQTKNTL